MNKIKCQYNQVESIIKHHGMNWDGLILNKVDFTYRNLTKISLPNDPKLFQRIKDKSLYNCRLPARDYSNCNFEGVDIESCIFEENSNLPSKTDLFQKVKNKSLLWCKLPDGDYSECDFSGVTLCGCQFTENSIFPRDPEVFQTIWLKSLRGCKLPLSTIKKIHLYNLDGVEINLGDYVGTLTKLQHSLIKAKYAEQIGKNVLLPDYIHCIGN